MKLDPENAANIHAAERMASFHDALVDGGYAGGELDRLLTQILFCLFAEDTGIFEAHSFTSLIEARTRADGSDLGLQLTHFFQVLSTKPGQGALFTPTLRIATFDANMRTKLLDCAALDWSKISPAVFGSIFQGVMDPVERRQIGAHYTSEREILRVLRDLFLADFEAELEDALHLASGREQGGSPGRTQRLRQLHDRLTSTRFLDPACGCGNFLILAYRELRRLEQRILVALPTTDLAASPRVSGQQFYGIELLAFPAEIARVGMWLTDHQMNRSLGEALGQSVPPTGAVHIVTANALQLDWREVLPASDEVLVLGNPPFVGKHRMSAEQSADTTRIWAGAGAAAVLDYVANWYRLAAQYMFGTRARTAFVSTSSITQGEQPGALWPDLCARLGIKIHFAHRTFPWTNDCYGNARGRAHVHVVIIGFAAHDTERKTIVGEQELGAEPTRERVPNISPYLHRGPDLALPSRSRPLARVPACQYGSKPNEGGHLLLEPDESAALLRAAPELRPWIRPLLGAEHFLAGTRRDCLWLEGAPPTILRHPAIAPRLRRVAEFRRASKKPATRAKAQGPERFAEVRQPSAPFLVIPLHSSEGRRYIPFGYFTPDYIVHNSCSFVPDASLFHFGVLSSALHMAWVRVVCGRLESRYRYSTRLVYNNFPWPDEGPLCDAVTAAASALLDARASFSDLPLSTLYAPRALPPALARAHACLDDAVDRCYYKAAFRSDSERVEHLFARYQDLLAASSHMSFST